MAPRNLKFGCAEAATSLALARYIDAAVLAGRFMPGRRKTTMCENDFCVGSAYRKDVGEGADVGSVIGGRPAGMRPKSGPDDIVCLRRGR